MDDHQPLVELRRDVARLEPAIADLLPAPAAARFRRMTLLALSRQPELAECDRRSVLDAVLRAAETGLAPDGRVAAIVTYRSKEGPPRAQFVPMVQGALRLAYASGAVAAIHAACVYAADRFAFRFEAGEPVLEHEPALAGDRGRITAAYAVAKMTSGALVVELLTREDLDKVRDGSKAADRGPWSTHFPRMAEKSAIHALCRRLPVGDAHGLGRLPDGPDAELVAVEAAAVEGVEA